MNLESSLVVSLIRSRSLRSTTQMMASIPCRKDEEKAAVTITLPISGASYACAYVWRQDTIIVKEREREAHLIVVAPEWANLVWAAHVPNERGERGTHKSRAKREQHTFQYQQVSDSLPLAACSTLNPMVGMTDFGSVSSA
jgi:hypothetical protein